MSAREGRKLVAKSSDGEYTLIAEATAQTVRIPERPENLKVGADRCGANGSVTFDHKRVPRP